METIREGTAEIRFTHPNAFREWVRQHKRREMVEKLLSEREAIVRLVADGDYIAYDFSSLTRGPQALVREIIRQRRKDLWVCAEFTLHETALLVRGGCASRIDVGFLGYGNYICRAVGEGRVRVLDWTNGTLASRMLAAARGVPFMPVRTLLGTDTLCRSGARVVSDPFTGDPICLVPALNPDVFLLYVHQADLFGNARIFGTNPFALEAAMAAKKVVLSTEEIIEPLEFRKNPAWTTIPHFLVDAVSICPSARTPPACRAATSWIWSTSTSSCHSDGRPDAGLPQGVRVRGEGSCRLPGEEGRLAAAARSHAVSNDSRRIPLRQFGMANANRGRETDPEIPHSSFRTPHLIRCWLSSPTPSS